MCAAKSPKSKKGASPLALPHREEMKEAFPPELTDIMYGYALPFPLNQVITRGLRYLVRLAARGAERHGTYLLLILEPKYELSEHMQIFYEEKRCEKCEGLKGCFEVHLPNYRDENVCRISDVLAMVQKRLEKGYEIKRVVLRYGPSDIHTLYEKTFGGKEFSALDHGYFRPHSERDKKIPLPRDF